MENFERKQIDSKHLPDRVVEKWSASVLSEGFVPFPKKLVRCLHRLFPNSPEMKQLSAVLAVVDFKRPHLLRKPSLAYLSFLAGLETNEFAQALVALNQSGFATCEGPDSDMEVSLDGLLEAIERETASEPT